MKSLYTLVGMKHRGTEKLVAGMSPGETLRLRRAPDNPHDPNAVEVWYGIRHVAFIKATEAVELAATMDGIHLSTAIGAYRVTGERWPQVEVNW